VAIAPWELWAWSATGRLLPLSSAGRTQLVTSIVPPSDTAFDETAPADVKALVRRARLQKASLGTPAGITRFLWNETQDHPAAVIKLLVLKAVWPWYVTFSGRLDLLIAIAQLGYVSLAIAGAVVAWKKGDHERRAVILILAITAYSWAIAFATTPRVRYMVPALGLLLILAARAITPLAQRVAPKLFGS
jgi:hypothetical protein